MRSGPLRFRLWSATDFNFIDAVYGSAQADNGLDNRFVGYIAAFDGNHRGLGFLINFGDRNLDAATAVPVGNDASKFERIRLMGL